MALIRLFSATPEFDFLSRRFLFFGFSLALVLASIGLFLFQGLNFGVDFRGGTLLEVRIKEGTTISDLRSRVSPVCRLARSPCRNSATRRIS
jgi:preprotein translocase subunit SecF